MKMTMLLFALAVAMLPGTMAAADVMYPCAHPHDMHTFCDRDLPISARVSNLVSSLRTEEKIGLLANAAIAVPRLGLPKYEWWSEALHGVAVSPGVSFTGPIQAATSFPQPILTAASFNATLFNAIGQVISNEARAFHNLGQGGLTYWTPNINIFRDPRWGRGQETPGEDPLLTSVYAEYFVRGLQEGQYDGDATPPAPAKLKISACCKHFAAYDMDVWHGVERYGFNAEVTQQDLEDSFNPPFRGCIQKGGASGLMCSYNAVNGIPTCADPKLLTTTARGLWGFDGYVVSDCDAVQTIYADHVYADPEHAVAVVLKAGMDVNCGNTSSNYTGRALKKNYISETDIDGALARSFAVQFRLGMFDGNPLNQTFGSLGKADICSEGNQRLALEAAVQSIVLLKNEGGALPLSAGKIGRLAVIGPNANDTLNTMLGNYAGIPCTYVTPKQGLEAYVKKIHFVAGCSNTTCETADIRAATSAAGKADATVIVMGLGQDQEREAFDRESLLLPGKQQLLIQSVAAQAKAPVVLVVMSGGSVDISFAKDSKNVAAILWVGYPGQAGGEALAKIIFGERNPGGKLPATWYSQSFTSWPMTTMNMRPDTSTGYPGRTYRFYTDTTIYNFGEGMSYSKFEHTFVNNPRHLSTPSDQQMLCHFDRSECTLGDSQACSAMDFNVQVMVVNEAERAGSDVVLLYASAPGAGGGGLALKQLVGFQRIDLEGNSTIIVDFRISPCSHLATTKLDGSKTLLKGTHTLSLNAGEGELHVKLY